MLSVDVTHPEAGRARKLLAEAIVAAQENTGAPNTLGPTQISLDCLLSRQLSHDERAATEERALDVLRRLHSSAPGTAAASQLLHKLVESLPPAGSDGTFHGMTIAAATDIPYDHLREQLMGWASSVRSEATMRRFSVTPACSLADDPLSRNIITTIRNILAIETELCKAGALGEPSSFANLQALIMHTAHTPPQQVWDMLAIMDKVLFGDGDVPSGPSTLRQKSTDLMADVSREIAAFESGMIGHLRSNAALGAIHELHEISVDKILLDTLSLRQQATRNRGLLQELPPTYNSSVAAFRSAEFAAISAGEHLPLSSRESLGKRLSLGQSTIQAQELRLADDLAFFCLEFAPIAARPTSPVESAFFDGMVRAVVQEYCTRAEGHRVKSRSSLESLPTFDSYEEATVALLLERYIPGFTLTKGSSFHIKNGDKIHDFELILNHEGEPQRTILEYHVPRLFYSKTKGGDFRTMDEYTDYKRIRLGLPPEERTNFDDAVKVRLLHRYHEEREAVMAGNPAFSQHQLITIGSPIQLYYEIHKINRHIPGEQEFLDEFERTKAGFARK
jgi:hypothetical protein